MKRMKLRRLRQMPLFHPFPRRTDENILKPEPKHHTGEFCWVAGEKKFIAEASTLQWRKGWPVLGRVYNDACDEGFTLISDRTGTEMTVIIDAVDRSEDYSGGWRAITFVPAERSNRNLFKVVVIND